MSIDWRIDHYQVVNSTQDYVRDALELSDALREDAGLVVQAMSQMGGKGRHGNKWDAPIGNLYMSILLRPTCGLSRAGELAFVSAVALSDALDAYIDGDKHVKTVKWPNDILVNGLKISGILLESHLVDNKLDGIILGIGVNIFRAPELAVALNDVAKEPVYVNKVRDHILARLAHYMEVWEAQGFGPIREEWMKNAHGLGGPMTARLPNISHKGKFKGITQEGSLILEAEEGDKIITAADVHFGETTGEETSKENKE